MGNKLWLDITPEQAMMLKEDFEVIEIALKAMAKQEAFESPHTSEITNAKANSYKAVRIKINSILHQHMTPR